MKKYILFYSDRCIFSKKIRIALEKTTLFSNIHLFCIDEQMELIPPKIKRVPTLVVSGQEQYMGEDILDWATKLTSTPTDKKYPDDLLSTPNSLSPLSSMEYTFITEKEEKENMDSFLNNNFSLIDNPENAINAYKEQQEKTGQKKCTESEYEAFIKEREKIR